MLRLRLYNAALEEYGEIPLQVDTGYEGPIMLPRSEYEFFMIGELPRSLWRTYRTLADTVTMRLARGVAELAGRRIEVYIESPLHGGGKRLVGRAAEQATPTPRRPTLHKLHPQPRPLARAQAKRPTSIGWQRRSNPSAQEPHREPLNQPPPKPRRDPLGYASARVLEALLGVLALEFLERSHTRSAAGKAFQAWRALTGALLAIEQDSIAEEQRKRLPKRAIPRAPGLTRRGLPLRTICYS